MMSKILYIFKLTQDDIGPREHVKNILKYTSHDIEVITNSSNSIWDRFLKKCILDKTKNSLLNILLFQAYAAFFIIHNRKKYDVILLRQSVGFFLLPVLSRILGITIIVEVNGLQYQDLLDRKKIFLAKVNHIFEFLTYFFANKIICVHQNIKDNLTDKFTILDKNSIKIKVIENGIEPIKYISCIEAKQRDSISSSGFRIGYLGSHAYREGIDLFPEVAKSLKGQKIKFILIGGTLENLEIYRHKLKEYSIEEMFELVPYLAIEEALSKLQTCDICIHLRRPISGKSNSQGSPLKMLDYHNIGRYVIASDIDSYQYIKSNDFGLLVDFSSDNFIQDTVDTIDSLVGDDTIVNKGELAHNFIQNKSWSNQIKKLDMEMEKV